MTYPISLDYFTNGNILNQIIAENMIDISMLQEGHECFEKKAVFCFVKAYEICEDMSNCQPTIWKIPDYLKMAHYPIGDRDLVKIIQAVTLTIVYIYIEHFHQGWKDFFKVFIDKVKDTILGMHIKGVDGSRQFENLVPAQLRQTVCADAFRTLRRGTNIDFELSVHDFWYSGYIKDASEEMFQKQIDETVKKVVDEIPVPYSEVIGTTLHIGTMPKKEYDALNKAKGNGEQISIAKLRKENVEHNKKIKKLEGEIENSQQEEELSTNKKYDQLKMEFDRLKELHEEMLVELLKHILYENEQNAKDFLSKIKEKSDVEITDLVHKGVKDKVISSKSYKRDLWRILHAAKIYNATESNWNTVLRTHSND